MDCINIFNENSRGALLSVNVDNNQWILKVTEKFNIVLKANRQVARNSDGQIVMAAKYLGIIFLHFKMNRN